MVKTLEKLKNLKINGNHAVILVKLLNEEDIEKYIFTYKINLAEIRYLIRKGFIEMETAGTTFGFSTCTLTPLGVEVAKHLADEDVSEVKEEVAAKKLSIVDNLDWIEDWRKLFSEKKVGAGGSKAEVHKKMELFLKENPDVTSEDIFNATEKYFQSLDNIKFMQQADYFIYKGKGKDASSRLSQWLEVIKEEGTEDEWGERL
jgi:hypothetical protein